MAGADLKDAQAQMRHSRASTTADIYQQFVPESQRRAVNSLMELPTKRSDSVNYWSHFGATGDFRGLQMIDFMVPGARIAPWCHEPKPAHSFPYRGGRMRAASYFRQKPSSTGDSRSPEHAAHRTSFLAKMWPHCSSKGPTVNSRERLFERSRRTRTGWRPSGCEAGGFR